MNPKLGEDTTNDNLRLGQILVIYHILKVLKLVIIIANCTFFVGMFWLIICKMEDNSQSEEGFTFFTKFGLNNLSDRKQAIKTIYFTFCSLSTVGFGDLYPVSDLERLCCIFILVLGVGTFTSVMDNLEQMVVNINIFNQGFDQDEELQRFLGVIFKFNGGLAMDKDLKRQIIDHFHFKWMHDRNQALFHEKDLEILNQMPEFV